MKAETKKTAGETVGFAVLALVVSALCLSPAIVAAVDFMK